MWSPCDIFKSSLSINKIEGKTCFFKTEKGFQKHFFQFQSLIWSFLMYTLRSKILQGENKTFLFLGFEKLITLSKVAKSLGLLYFSQLLIESLDNLLTLQKWNSCLWTFQAREKLNSNVLSLFTQSAKIRPHHHWEKRMEGVLFSHPRKFLKN